MQTISLADIPGIRIGQVEDAEGGTGATVIVAPDGMAAGVDVRGGGPASRDSRILDPLAAAEGIHAVLFAGGSAFGLDAAGGVQHFLEERGIGLPVGDVRVPLVCQSDIFDLLVGRSDVRPDAAMGYAACEAAFQGDAGNYRDGNYGAGCGATVGKVLGGDFCMKSGVGSYAVQLGELKIGALVVLNALGDVRDPSTGQTVAGVRSADGRSLGNTVAILSSGYEAHSPGPGGAGVVSNTTLGAVVTNARLSKAQLCKLAGMAHDGLARTIYPVHTAMDGDSIYGLSVGSVEASLDLVGTVAAEVVAQAVLVAARSAEAAFGLPSAKGLGCNA